MKLWIVGAVAISFCAVLALPAVAQEAAQGAKRPQRGKFMKKLLEKYDKDKDGKLNEEERAAARKDREKELAARRAEMIKKFDKNGDGKLDDKERAAAREAFLLKRFDKDGDGKLNEEEKAAMEKARQEWRKRGGRPGGGPRGHRPNREELLKKFDANKNGKLDPDEREKAMQEMRKHRAERGEHEHHRGSGTRNEK